MSRGASVVQAYFEEMEAIFEVLKVARRVANGDARVSLLEMALDDLDHLRATHRPTEP